MMASLRINEVANVVPVLLCIPVYQKRAVRYDGNFRWQVNESKRKSLMAPSDTI